MQLYPDSEMWKMCEGNINRVSGYTPFRAADNGDKAAIRVVSEFIDYLAIGASNIINILQPDVLCIGGGISGEGENLMAPLRERIERISFGSTDGRTRVCVAKYMNDAGIIGAAGLGK